MEQFDHDHDGEIPLSELSNALNSVSANGIPAEVVNELAWRADRDHNGVLDFDGLYFYIIKNICYVLMILMMSTYVERLFEPRFQWIRNMMELNEVFNTQEM